ncbi:hypothetical protein CPB83DRAFT_906130 [Crepidotus variabilis]|uniref:Uncharacterized protein n=1 Tax=Crepidotus variabilis TaxID=179855 RepID=A0A9P6EIF0_9AGAR|nr:hypothetical protein CPB83DRAFT_906130 [Crepidotus variabilis]
MRVPDSSLRLHIFSGEISRYRSVVFTILAATLGLGLNVSPDWNWFDPLNLDRPPSGDAQLTDAVVEDFVPASISTSTNVNVRCPQSCSSKLERCTASCKRQDHPGTRVAITLKTNMKTLSRSNQARAQARAESHMNGAVAYSECMDSGSGSASRTNVEAGGVYRVASTRNKGVNEVVPGGGVTCVAVCASMRARVASTTTCSDDSFPETTLTFFAHNWPLSLLNVECRTRFVAYRHLGTRSFDLAFG